MKTHGITHEQIAMVAVVQREWREESARHHEGADHGRGCADSRMIAYPFHPAVLPRHDGGVAR